MGAGGGKEEASSMFRTVCFIPDHAITLACIRTDVLGMKKRTTQEIRNPMSYKRWPNRSLCRAGRLSKQPDAEPSW